MSQRGSSRRRSENPCLGGRGFTLIELMIVMGLMALLIAIAIPRFFGTREKAHRSQMQTTLHNLVSAQEAYFDENLAYAPDVANLDFNPTPSVAITILETAGNGWSARATHENTDIECGIYIGPVTPPSGITFQSEGLITCSE